jgi:glycosyltransferase involved in cell wall biosynthesis
VERGSARGEKVWVVHNCAELAVVEAAQPAPLAELGLANEQPLVLTACRLTPQKGVDVLLRA